MPSGLELLGNALGGTSENAYQEGRAMGAKTEDALASARRRVMENEAIARGRSNLIASGVPEDQAQLMADSVAAGKNYGDPIEAMLKQQEYGFRKTAGDPMTSITNANAALRGVAPGPVDRYQKVGGGADDRFDEAGIQPLGDMVGGDGGGSSATVQAWRAYGLLDAAGQIKPGMEALAYEIQRNTDKVYDAGGVPTLHSGNPFGAPRAFGAPPAAPAAPVAPAAPGMMPSAAAPVAAPPPLSNVDEVARNTAAIASAKEQGSAQGRNAAGIESTNATIDKFDQDIDAFLTKPGYNGIYGNLQGTEVGKAVTGALDQDVADARGAIESLGGEAFLASIQKMRGFGQLSNQEGGKVQTALTRALDTRISEPDSRAAWGEVKRHLAELKRVAATEAGQGGAQTAPTAPAAAERTATGPNGQKLVLRNGQWTPQ